MPANGSTCYFPNYQSSPEDQPCNIQAGQSACCRPSDLCLDNGYCFGARDGGPNIVTRGSCTDPSFNDYRCPSYCKDVNKQGATMLFMATYANPAKFCCGPFNSTSETCNESTLGKDTPFPLDNANVVTNRVTGATFNTNLTQLMPNSTTEMATITAQATSKITLMATEHSVCREAPIGAGVGSSFGIALLLALVALVFQHRRFVRAQRNWAEERADLCPSRDIPNEKEARFSPPFEADHTHMIRPVFHEIGSRNTLPPPEE